METQETITEWATAKFGRQETKDVVRRLLIECDELEATYREGGDCEGECADVCVVLMQLAERWHFDLLEATTKKMKVNRGRNWTFDQESQTFRHI